MIPSFESIAIVVMSCLGAFVIGFVVGYAVRDETEIRKTSTPFNSPRVVSNGKDNV